MSERTFSADGKRYGAKPNGKPYELDDEMIGLRDRLAVALGYVLRDCSMGGGFECWERPELTAEWRGRKISPFHSVRVTNMDIRGHRFLRWPEDVEKAAYAIDGGRPKDRIAAAETPLFS